MIKNCDMPRCDSFLRTAINSNRKLVCAVSVFSIVIELFNIIRVLFLSSMGLRTLNNRIYFSFYLALLLVSAVLLMVDRFVSMRPRTQYRFYLGGMSVLLLWQTLFNIYDDFRGGEVEMVTVVTAIVAFSALTVMRPADAFWNLAVNYALFAAFLLRCSGSGSLINFTITTLLSGVIYGVHYSHICTEIKQQKEIEDTHQRLDETEREFLLTQEQYDLIRQSGKFITFKWNIADGGVHFSPEWGERFQTSTFFPDLISYIHQSVRMEPRQKELLLQNLDRIRNGLPYCKQEFLLTQSGGIERWFEMHLILQQDIKNNLRFGLGLLMDITSQKEYSLQLERELQQDTLTGILNRSALENYGVRKLNALLPDTELAMLILDLDNFKNVNDTYGHPCGDQILRETALTMKNLAPEGARVGRLGGDEFMILLAGPAAREALCRCGGQIIEKLSQIDCQEPGLTIECSMGVAAIAGSGAYLELYQNTDQALYHAKNHGKQCLCQFDPEKELSYKILYLAKPLKGGDAKL